MCRVDQLAELCLEELHSLQSSGDIQGTTQLMIYHHPDMKVTYSRKVKTHQFSACLRLM